MLQDINSVVNSHHLMANTSHDVNVTPAKISSSSANYMSSSRLQIWMLPMKRAKERTDYTNSDSAEEEDPCLVQALPIIEVSLSHSLPAPNAFKWRQ